MSKKVAIIGSGISALACATVLKEKGISFKVFEKDNRVGGKILTENIDEFIVEGGPDSYLPEKYWSVQLIKKVGLEKEMLTTNDEFKGTYIYSNRRLHPLPEGVMLMVPTMIMPLAKSNLISWPGKIRMGLELFIPPKKENSDESLAEFVTRRLGKECLEKIAEPLVAGIHTSNPDNMSVLATFPRFVEMEKKYGSLIKGMLMAKKMAPPPKEGGQKMTYFMSMKSGMQELVEGILKFIGYKNICLSKELSFIEKQGDGYSLIFSDGTREYFDSVVLSTPSYVTKDIIKDIDFDLSNLLASIGWSSSATINIALKRDDIKVPLKGFGFIVPRIENRRINACTYSSIKWSYRAPNGFMLFRCFVGGGHHEELVNLDDKELLKIVMEELKDIAGINGNPIFTKVYRWINGMPKYTVGHLDRINNIFNRLKNHKNLYLIGCSYKGIGIGDCVKSGFDAASEISSGLIN